MRDARSVIQLRKVVLWPPGGMHAVADEHFETQQGLDRQSWTVWTAWFFRAGRDAAPSTHVLSTDFALHREKVIRRYLFEQPTPGSQSNRKGRVFGLRTLQTDRPGIVRTDECGVFSWHGVAIILRRGSVSGPGQ